MSPELDLERVLCPLRELPDPGARGFVRGEGDWPLRGFVVRPGSGCACCRCGSKGVT